MGVIQSGSFSGNTTVSIGWEPQWIMIKRTDAAGNWITIDSMRGCSVGGIDAVLSPNLSSAESVANDYIDFTATGFISKNLTGNYIYMVIRRPNKPPTSGSEVYMADGADTTSPAFDSGFPVDFAMIRNRSGAGATPQAVTRLCGNNTLHTGTTAAEVSYDARFDQQDGIVGGFTSSTYISWMFKRAKCFFDIVAYTASGANYSLKTVEHGLGVVPEMQIVKSRTADGYGYWIVGHKDIGATSNLVLQNTGAKTANVFFGNSYPTSTQLQVQYELNTSGNNYIAYLFASIPNVSKVGSYTGNGTSQTINCGFTSGSRFVLVKRFDVGSTGDWYVWDTARGIVSANDPHLSLNTTAAEVTTDDSVDPEATGFIVNQNTATNINVNGGSYIFLSIA